MRIHLSTAFVVMITAALLVGLNMRSQVDEGMVPSQIPKDYSTLGWPWKYSSSYTVTTVSWTPTGPVSESKVVTTNDASAFVTDFLVCLALLVNLGGLCERVARGLKLQA